MRLPHPILLRLLLRRGVVLWVGARLLSLAALAMARSASVAPGPFTFHLGGVGTVWFLALLVLVFWLDLRRRREPVLLSNLGVAPATASVLACLPALAGEMAVISFLP